jgi:hypothetical protein
MQSRHRSDASAASVGSDGSAPLTSAVSHLNIGNHPNNAAASSSAAAAAAAASASASAAAASGQARGPVRVNSSGSGSKRSRDSDEESDSGFLVVPRALAGSSDAEHDGAAASDDRGAAREAKRRAIPDAARKPTSGRAAALFAAKDATNVLERMKKRQMEMKAGAPKGRSQLRTGADFIDGDVEVSSDEEVSADEDEDAEMDDEELNKLRTFIADEDDGEESEKSDDPDDDPDRRTPDIELMDSAAMREKAKRDHRPAAENEEEDLAQIDNMSEEELQKLAAQYGPESVESRMSSNDYRDRYDKRFADEVGASILSFYLSMKEGSPVPVDTLQNLTSALSTKFGMKASDISGSAASQADDDDNDDVPVDYMTVAKQLFGGPLKLSESSMETRLDQYRSQYKTEVDMLAQMWANCNVNVAIMRCLVQLLNSMKAAIGTMFEIRLNELRTFNITHIGGSETSDVYNCESVYKAISETDKDLSRSQKLNMYINECGRQMKLLKFGADLHIKNRTKNGFEKPSYKKHMSIKQFIYMMSKMNVSPEQWKNRTFENNTVAKVERDIMESCEDTIPVLNRLRDAWTFEDVFYDGSDDTWYEYGKDAMPPGKVAARDIPYPLKDKDKVGPDYYSVPDVNGNMLYFNEDRKPITKPPFKSWMDIETPIVDGIMKDQGWTRSVRKWFWVFMGRLAYPVGSKNGGDNWQRVVMLYGKGGTGKSTLAKHFCLHRLTMVTTANGFSMPINRVQKGTNVLSYDDKLGGHVLRKTNALLDQGERACVEMMFADGRTIKCTPDHRFMTKDGEWVEAQKLKIGESKIKASMEYPAMISPDERDRAWKLDLPSLGYSLNTHDRLEHAVAFAGLMGYLMTDGCVNKENSTLYMGHDLDVEWVKRDIKLLTGMDATSTVDGKVTYVILPRALHLAMKHVGVSSEGRLTSVESFPPFLLHSSCPVAVVQSFLGGLFGGDGKAPSLSWSSGKAHMAEIRFSCSRKGSVHAQAAQAITDGLQTLFRRVGMDEGSLKFGRAVHQVTSITQAGRDEIVRRKHAGEPLSVTASKDAFIPEQSYSMVWNISLNETLAFSERVGFRYSCHKQMRLTAAATCYRLKAVLNRQKKFLQDYVLEYETANGGRKLKTSNLPTVLTAAKAALALTECVHPIIQEFVPVENRRRGLFQAAGGYSFDELLRTSDCLKFFSTPHKGRKYNSKARQDELQVASMSGDAADASQSSGERMDVEPSAPGAVATSDKVTYGVPAGAPALPTFEVELVARREIPGVLPVFDISVPETLNFTAQSLVSHNCQMALPDDIFDIECSGEGVFGLEAAFYPAKKWIWRILEVKSDRNTLGSERWQKLVEGGPIPVPRKGKSREHSEEFDLIGIMCGNDHLPYDDSQDNIGRRVESWECKRIVKRDMGLGERLNPELPNDIRKAVCARRFVQGWLKDRDPSEFMGEYFKMTKQNIKSSVDITTQFVTQACIKKPGSIVPFNVFKTEMGKWMAQAKRVSNKKNMPNDDQIEATLAMNSARLLHVKDPRAQTLFDKMTDFEMVPVDSRAQDPAQSNVEAEVTLIYREDGSDRTDVTTMAQGQYVKGLEIMEMKVVYGVQ